MGPCLYPSSWVVTKRRFPLQPGTQSIGLCTSRLAMCTMRCVVPMSMPWPCWPFFRSLRVSATSVVSSLTELPAANKRYAGTTKFRTFRREVFHRSLEHVLNTLKPGMSKAEVVRCPDGHFRRAIYGLGPYIADYPEQVLVACIVQNWCVK
jgi:hypothetical protein